MANEYRVTEYEGGFVPEILANPESWRPLNPNGYWADAASTPPHMTREEAEAAVAKAKAINGDGGTVL